MCAELPALVELLASLVPQVVLELLVFEAALAHVVLLVCHLEAPQEHVDKAVLEEQLALAAPLASEVLPARAALLVHEVPLVHEARPELVEPMAWSARQEIAALLEPEE